MVEIQANRAFFFFFFILSLLNNNTLKKRGIRKRSYGYNVNLVDTFVAFSFYFRSNSDAFIKIGIKSQYVYKEITGGNLKQ